MTSMAPAPVMPKNVHQQASEREQIEERAKNVRLMVIPQQDDGDAQEAEADEEGPRCPETALRRCAAVAM